MRAPSLVQLPAQWMQVVATGIASSRSVGIAPAHRAHVS